MYRWSNGMVPGRLKSMAGPRICSNSSSSAVKRTISHSSGAYMTMPVLSPAAHDRTRLHEIAVHHAGLAQRLGGQQAPVLAPQHQHVLLPGLQGRDEIVLYQPFDGLFDGVIGPDLGFDGFAAVHVDEFDPY